jgi:hypothetical protein
MLGIDLFPFMMFVLMKKLNKVFIRITRLRVLPHQLKEQILIGDLIFDKAIFSLAEMLRNCYPLTLS